MRARRAIHPAVTVSRVRAKFRLFWIPLSDLLKLRRILSHSGPVCGKFVPQKNRDCLWGFPSQWAVCDLNRQAETNNQA